MSRAVKPRAALRPLSLQCCSFPPPKILLIIHFVLASPGKQMTVKPRVLHDHRLRDGNSNRLSSSFAVAAPPVHWLGNRQMDQPATRHLPRALQPWDRGTRVPEGEEPADGDRSPTLPARVSQEQPWKEAKQCQAPPWHGFHAPTQQFKEDFHTTQDYLNPKGKYYCVINF